MKITYIFFLLLLFPLVTVEAQSTHFSVNETQHFKDIKGNTDILSVHHLDQGIVAVRSIKKGLVLSTFDNSYNFKTNIELDIEKKETYVGSAYVNGILRVFTSHKVDKKNIDMYCTTFFAGKGRGVKKKLYSVTTGKRKGKGFFGWYVPSLRKYEENFRISPDGKFLAFAIDNFNNKAHTSSFKVYDQDLTLLFDKKYIEDSKTVYQFDDFVVTNDGEVITAGKQYKSGRTDKKNGKANYDYVLHKVTENESTKKQIDLGDNFIKEVRFAQNGPKLRLLGFYSGRNSSRMKGGISYSFDGSNISNVQPKVSPFPKEVFDDIYSETKAKRLKGKEKEFRSYYLDYSLEDEDGNAYLLAEQFYITTHTQGGANGIMTTYTVTHYDNVLVVKFDPEGNLSWGRGLYKKSTAPSYNAIVNEGKLHVFLNTGKNLKEKIDGRKKLKKGWLEKTALYDVVHSESGEQTFEKIKDNDGRKDFFSPFKGSWEDETFVIPNFSKSKKRFLVLSRK